MALQLPMLRVAVLWMAESTIRYRFDKVLLWTTFILFVVTFQATRSSLVYLGAALTNIFFFLMILRITSAPPETGAAAWLRWLYPLLLLVPLNFQVEMVGTVFHGGEVYDHLVREWDKALFGTYLHRAFPEALPGVLWRELLHLFYAAYYPLVMGSYIWVWWQGFRGASSNGPRVSPALLRFAFVLLGTFCTYLAIFVLFPVIGPLDDRYLRFDGVGLVGPFIDWLYGIAASQGGALPSSHVGESVVVVLLLRPRDRRVTAALWVLVAGLTLGTVYGSFHYAIDAVTGLISGALLYLFWNGLYRRWGAEIQTVPADAG